MRGNVSCFVILILLSGCSLGSQWTGRGTPKEPYPDINSVSMNDMCTPPPDAPKPDVNDKKQMEQTQNDLSKQGKELWRKTFQRQGD
jgi:hypothetical protein